MDTRVPALNSPRSSDLTGGSFKNPFTLSVLCVLKPYNTNRVITPSHETDPIYFCPDPFPFPDRRTRRSRQPAQRLLRSDARTVSGLQSGLRQGVQGEDRERR